MRRYDKNDGAADIKGWSKIFLIAMIVWTPLQMSRFIAIPLINDIETGAEAEAWRCPAYLDLFAAVFAPPLI